MQHKIKNTKSEIKFQKKNQKKTKIQNKNQK